MRSNPAARHVWLLTCAVALAFGTAIFGQTSDATKVLADARQALGGEKKLDALKSLTVTGRSIRTMPNGQSSEGDFEMAMELPDKFVRRDVLAAMGTMSVYRLSGFNGDGVINEVDTPPQLSAGGNVQIIMRGVGPGGVGATGGEPTPEQKEAARRSVLNTAKTDFARLALGFLAKSPPSVPLTMTYAGSAESPDGTADVIDVKGDNDFAAKLFIDSKTHLPLMLNWMDRERLVITRTATAPGSGGGGAVSFSGSASPANMSPEDRKKFEDDTARQVKEAQAKRRTVEYRLFYSDYKNVDGVMVPHRIQTSIDGKPTEEITFEKVKANQKIDAKRFEVSKQ